MTIAVFVLSLLGAMALQRMSKKRFIESFLEKASHALMYELVSF